VFGHPALAEAPVDERAPRAKIAKQLVGAVAMLAEAMEATEARR
jgi:hypothetical protein